MQSIIEKLNTLDRAKFEEYCIKTDLDMLHKLKLYLDDLYYNTDKDSGMVDWKYDILKESLLKRDPTWKVPVGSRIRENENRAKLPFWLGSMNKIYPQDVDLFDKWLVNNPSNNGYSVESKLDGISCLLIYSSGKIKLYTRGDGEIGADISYLDRYVNGIPKYTKDIAVRGELIMKRGTFNSKYKKDYKTPRNFVSGRTGAKTIRIGLEDIDFIAYEIVDDGLLPPPSKQLEILKNMGFTVVQAEIITDITIDDLSANFLERRKTTLYDIDGLIVQPNVEYMRNTSGNPEYSFAYKMVVDENIVHVKVVGVDWNISKWGYLKPRIEYEPVEIGGTTNTWTTGFNARYITENSIGPGSILELTRSGDTIPYILKVLESSPEPDMPEIPYRWNTTGVDIIAEDKETICIKLIANIFSKIGAKHVAEQTVRKLYDGGYDTFFKIIEGTPSDFAKIEGFQAKLAQRTYDSIHQSLQQVNMSDILGSCGIFGFGIGSRKIKVLLVAFPDIFDVYHTMSKKQLFNKILTIEGYSDKTAQKIVDGVEIADKFIKKLSEWATFKEQKKIDQSLQSEIIVFSGTRPERYEGLRDEIEGRGGKISTGVSGKTTILVVKDKSQITGKVQKAQEKGTSVLTVEDFVKKYIKK